MSSAKPAEEDEAEEEDEELGVAETYADYMPSKGSVPPHIPLYLRISVMPSHTDLDFHCSQDRNQAPGPGSRDVVAVICGASRRLVRRQDTRGCEWISSLMFTRRQYLYGCCTVHDWCG